jgi:hypothetical protein
MTRPISTKTHGAIDYAWATIAAALPSAIDDAPATARLVRAAGYAASMSSMVTNYEAGAMRIMPMKAHLALDVAMCAVLLASPLFLPRSERHRAVVPVALGAAGFVTALLTETGSPGE